MDIEKAAGQMLVAGFEGSASAPPDAIHEALEAGRLGGVIAFDRNIETLDQLVELNRTIHEAAESAPASPFVAVDQEGGRVMRIRDEVTPIPPMQTVGQNGDVELIADISSVIATELAALGFNLNFAPVLDVATNPLNEVIGDRAFGRDPEFVSIAGGTYLFGHYKAGVLPCGKHFPGHGDTTADSHEQLPILKHDRERLNRVELHPFRRIINNDIPLLMTAHMLVPALDPNHPVTLSKPIIDDLLRTQLGYEGIVMTDDLAMDALSDHYSIEQMLELGVEAGVDCFLFAQPEQDWRRAHELLVEKARADTKFKERIVASANKIVETKQEYFGHQPRPWQPSNNWREIVGSEKHRKIVAEVEETESR